MTYPYRIFIQKTDALKKGTNLIIMSNVKNPFTLVRSPIDVRWAGCIGETVHTSRFMCDK